MKVHKNRYVWTNYGPVTVIDGGNYAPARVRRFLRKRGIEVKSWARNWAAFLGYMNESIVYMEEPE